MRFKLSEAHKIFIKANYTKMSRKKMANQLDIGVTPINTYMKNNNLSVSKEQSQKFAKLSNTGRSTFTKEEDLFIRNYYLTKSVKAIAKEMGRSYCGVTGRLKAMNLKIPKEVVEERKKQSQFRTGHTPPNKGKKQIEYMSTAAIEKTKKTRFKKGNLPYNYKGGEHLSKDGYVVKSLGDGKKALKHHLEWEKVHGKIPPKHILKCKTEDRSNTNPSNWELISMTENMLRNSRHNYPEEFIPALVLINQIKKQINI